jgi:hypothetical protein
LLTLFRHVVVCGADKTTRFTDMTTPTTPTTPTNSWFYITSAGGGEYVATLPTQPNEIAGAYGANGTFVPYPFTVIRPATPDEVEWAERELEVQEQADDGDDYLD